MPNVSPICTINTAILFCCSDTLPHPKNKAFLTKDLLVEQNINASRLLMEVFPGVPVYVAIGNHDYVPVNLLPPNGSYFYERLADEWKSWFNGNENAENSFRKGIYFV